MSLVEEATPAARSPRAARVPLPPEAAVIDHPSGFLALSDRNERFRAPGRQGFVAHRDHGRHLFAFGGVHAPPGADAPLLDAWLAEAARRGRRTVAVQVRPAQVDLFRSRGFVVNQLGSTFGLDLARFTMAGTRRMKLRNRIKRARDAGVRVLEVGCELPASAETFARLHAVSDAWIRAKKKKELDFMIGELGGPEHRARRVFVAVGAREALLGFITYVPVWGARPGWLHDLTRRLPDAPNGIMELVNSVALERMRAEGAPFLHFGFTPFVVDPVEPPGGSGIFARAVRLVGRWGGAIYPAQAQLQYKLKWAPDVIEREYVAARPLSLRAVWDLLRVTRSL
jgi:lysylphosphatidylglycerol synthetase-like protein (DUF2156 family)